MINRVLPVLRRADLVLGVICLVFGVLPIVLHGIFQSEGIIALLAGGGFLVFLSMGGKWAARWGSRWMVLEWVFHGLILIGLIAAAALTAMVLRYGYFHRPPTYQDTTLVVLGCKIYEDRPSLMLQRRLDAAYQVLEENPEVLCIVAGGQGSDEICPESQVMRDYLIQRGIAPDRVYEDALSRNTKENLENAKKLMDEHQMPGTVTIVTDGYHQFRAGLYADRLGIPFYNLSGRTPWDMFPAYLVREYFGIIKLAFFET